VKKVLGEEKVLNDRVLNCGKSKRFASLSLPALDIFQSGVGLYLGMTKEL
jgi:hypothetical protein